MNKEEGKTHLTLRELFYPSPAEPQYEPLCCSQTGPTIYQDLQLTIGLRDSTDFPERYLGPVFSAQASRRQHSAVPLATWTVIDF